MRAEEVFRWDRRRVRLKAPRGVGFRKVRRKRGRGVASVLAVVLSLIHI